MAESCMRRVGLSVQVRRAGMVPTLRKPTSDELGSAYSCTMRVSKYVSQYLTSRSIHQRFWSFFQAMRYPLNAHRKELAAADGAREREKERALEIQDSDIDDDDGLDSF